MRDRAAAGDVLTVVVFSKDRPLQLHATLSSLHSTCADPHRLRVRVLGYASDDAMATRYGTVAREMPWARIVPEDGFKRTLLASCADAPWLAFAVDDALFVRPWSAASAIEALRRHPEVIGVSLRLGRNTTYCYSMDRPQRVPSTCPVEGGWLACEWSREEADFAYPLELSSSIYRGSDLLPELEALAYRNPNELEAALAGRRAAFTRSRPVLLYPETTIAFCAPVNVVQRTFENRAGGSPDHSVAALAKAFDEGLRVDVAALRGYTPRACHEETRLPLAAPATEPPGSAPRTETDVPSVSVVIPCFRQAEFLVMAISSVALQTFEDWELIVVNDGSPDETSAAFRRIAARLPGRRLRLLEQPNAGLAHARNNGIRAARGRYILPLDADDALDAAFLARTVAVLDADPTLDIVACDVAVFGARTGTWRLRRPFTVEHLLQENGLPYCSLYRRAVWDRTGGYKPNIFGYEDWDFWVTAAEQGFRAHVIEEPLFLYREKQRSMLTEARGLHRSLRAQLVLNHRARFPEEACRAAERQLAEHPLPSPRTLTEPREIPSGPGRAPPHRGLLLARGGA